MKVVTDNANKIGGAIGGKIGRVVGNEAQEGDSLAKDITGAIVGGGIAGVISQSMGKSFAVTAVSTTVRNLNTTVDNHENRILNNNIPNPTAQSAIKTGTGVVQLGGEIAAMPGNLIIGAVEGALKRAENFTGPKNAALENANILINSVKTNNIVVDTVVSTLVNTVVMPDKILCGSLDASGKAMENVIKYGEKVVSNAGTLLSDLVNKAAQSFYNNPPPNNSPNNSPNSPSGSKPTNISSENINSLNNMFAQTFPSLGSQVHNSFGSQVQNRYSSLIQNHYQQEVARNAQIANTFRQQSIATAQNNARNLYLHNMRQTSSWATNTYWDFNKPKSDFEIRMALSGGASISSVAMRCNVSSSTVETVARGMGGIVYGGTYYSTPYQVGSFGSLLMLTGLCSSYNCYNLYGFGAYMSGLGWTGGVENDVGTIANLNPHGNHIFAIKSDSIPFLDDELIGLLCALKNGVFDYHSFPFYSLHFNNDGIMYPVMHEVYRGTIVGKVIEFLDYLMKGFLNGDIYKDGFAEKWHKNPIHDVTLLKEQLLKIKDIYKKQGKKYFSLREMLTLYDLDKSPNVVDPVNTVKGTDFQTSFRIIAYQKNIQQHENIFLINPSFRVEYTIDLPPSYKDFLENYKEQNGQYPKDYRNLQIVYSQFSKTIEEMLPLLPQAMKYFKMLGIINFFCYWFKTMQQLGYEPNFKNSKMQYEQQINALPPMPMRYYEKHLLTMSWEEMFTAISLPQVKKKLTDWLLDMGTKPENELLTVFKTFFETQLKPKTVDPTIDDDILPPIIEVILNNVKRGVKASIEGLYAECKIKESISNPITTLNNHKQKLIDELQTSKKQIEEQVKIVCDYKKMMLDMETTKRNNVEQFIIDSLKPYTAEQQAQNAVQINEFKNTNRSQCEKEISEMRIKFCHMLSFGEDMVTDVEIAKTNSDPIKSKLVQELFAELTDNLTFEEKLRINLEPVEKREKEIENGFNKIIESLHNIINELQIDLKNDKKELIIKYRYLHSVVEISDPVMLNSKGEKIRVVGGCGMRIENVTAEHIPNGVGFFKKIQSSNIKKLSFTPVNYLNEQYYVFSLDSGIRLKTSVEEINEIQEMQEEQKVNNELMMHNLGLSDDLNLIKENVLAHKNQLRTYNRYGLLPIHEATYNGYDSVLKEMLNVDPELLEIKTESGYTCLMLASEQGKTSCLQILLNAGACVDIVLFNGLFPLFLAIQNGFTDTALMLLNSPKIGNINRVVDSQMSCLHLAIELNLVSIVQKLISMGANLFIRRKKDSFIPFHCASSNGNCQIIQMLLNVNSTQMTTLTPVYSEPELANRGESPLHLAIANGHFDAVKILVTNPSCCMHCQNFNGDTPLMLAIEMGNEEIAKFLALHSTVQSLTCVNKVNNIALLLAGKKNMLSVGDIILQQNPTQLKYINNELSYVYYLIVNGAYARLHNLISKGEFNHRELINGQSCLDIASEFGHNLCVDYFLELGLTSKSNDLIEQSVRSDNVSYVKEWAKNNSLKMDSMKMKLIVLATEFGSVSVLKFLSQYITNDNISASTEHLLVTAMNSGSIECFKIIFGYCHFSKMNDKIDSEGNTLAHASIKSGNLKIIKILFRAGYSFTQPNNNGINAYQLGYKNKKITAIFKSVDMENHLIDISVKLGDTKSISHIRSVSKILDATLKYDQIYVIKWLQERDIFEEEITLFVKAFEQKNQKLNPHMANAFKNQWDKIDGYSNELEKIWSNGNFKETDWPLNIPINGQPILHIIFSQATIPNDKFMKGISNADPEQKDKKGFPLIFKLLKGSTGLKDDTLFEEKLNLLAKYFPKKIESILTQTDDYGCDIFVVLSKKQLKIVQKITKSSNSLIQAVHTSQIHRVIELLKMGENPYKTDSEQNTPLHLAIKNKDVPIASLLIKYMNRFDLYNNAGLTPFTLASTIGLISITDALKYQSNIYATSPSGLSALHYAAERGNIASVKYLLSLGMPIDLASEQIDDNDYGLTPLYIASYFGQLEMYNFLRKNGANVNIKTNKGDSIACALISANNQFLTDEVLTLPHFQDEKEQHKMLWQAAKMDNLDMLRILYLDSVKMDVCDENNYNALDLACAYGSRLATRFLINCGLSLSIDRKLVKDTTVLEYLNNQPELQALLPETKKYNGFTIEKVQPTIVTHSPSYLTLEEKQLLINLLGDSKLEFLASRIKIELGIRIFRTIFLINSKTNDEELSNIFHLLLNIAHYQEITVSMVKYSSFSELYSKLNADYTDIIRKTYPELPIEELKKKFSTTSEFVQTPLNNEQLDNLVEIYQKVIVIGESLVGLTPLELKNKLDKANFIEKIAIIRQAIYNSFRIFPYNTQMLTMLAFIIDHKNEEISKIGQIRTGEGKSVIIAMISMYYACNNRYVDVITTSHSLAIRDQLKYKKFCESLGITSSHICDHTPSNECFQALIVYGTISDFEFSILREKSFELKSRYINGSSRPCDIAIIDEVDNISLDAANNSSRISDESLNDYHWIYKPYYQFANSYQFDIDEIRDYLRSFGDIDSMEDNKLKELYNSARRAKSSLTEDIHYIVRPTGEIVIVDYENTGTAMESCTWSFGIHQFLEIKHNVKLTSEDITVAAMSHYSLIKQYKKIIGLTGTSGGKQEQDELRDLYGMEFFDVPPHFPNKRVTLEPIIYLTEQQQTEEIIKSATEITQQGRPVLIICRTIRDVMKLNEQFETTGLMYQIFTGKQITSEEEIIDKAGQAGMITIATNNSGRGTDIILSILALKNGGLHVIVTCYMKNVRTEDQAKGRAGRQGQPGSCQVMLSLMDPFVLELLIQGNNINLQSLRENNTSKCSIERIKAVRHNNEIFKIFLVFSQKFVEFKNMISEIPFDILRKQCQELIVSPPNPNANYKLQYLTSELIRLQSNGTEQAWGTFLGQLKAYYVQKLTQQWSDFFIRAERITTLQESFNEFMNKIVLTDNFALTIFQ